MLISVVIRDDPADRRRILEALRKIPSVLEVHEESESEGEDDDYEEDDDA